MKQFASLKEENKTKLIVEAIRAKIDGNKVDEEFNKCVANIPAPAFEGRDEEEVCIEYFRNHIEDLVKANGGNAAPAAPAPTAPAMMPNVPGGAVSNTSQPQVDNKKIKQTAEMLRHTVEKRQGYSKQVVLLKLLIDRPDPAQTIKEGTTFVPTTSLDKMEKYEKLLVTTDEESVKNFQILKDAVNAKKPIEANIPKFSPKVIGVIVRKPKDGADGTEDVVMTMDELKTFLLQFMLFAMIPSSGEVNLGAKIRQATSQSQTATGVQTVTYSVAFVNKREACESPNCSVVTSHKVVDKKGVEVLVPATLRSKLSFKIRNENGTKKDATRTVRLSGKGEVVKLERDKEYFDRFGEVMKDSSILVLPVTDKEKEQAIERQAAAIASIPGFDFGAFFDEPVAETTANADASLDI